MYKPLCKYIIRVRKLGSSIIIITATTTTTTTLSCALLN